MKAPVNSLVSIYYDSPVRVKENEYLRTPTGRLYLICDIRIQAKGRHIGRQHLKCLVKDSPDPGAVIHTIIWYKRGKNRKR